MAQTPILNIPLLASNQASKETTINDAIAYLEKATNDVKILDFTAGDMDIALIDLQRYFYFKTSNVGAPVALNLPSTAKRIFAIDNSGGADQITVVQGARSLVVATGEVYVVAATGTTLKFLYNSIVGGSISFPQLSDAPASYAGAGGFFVKVKASLDGLEFYDPDSGLGGFTGLSDTPSDYTDSALKILRVNEGHTAIEFVDQAKVASVVGIVTEGTTARSLASTDLGKVIRATSALPTIITVPNFSDTDFPVGGMVHVRQADDGEVSIAAASGVTINTPSTLVLAGRNATVTLMKVAFGEWDVFGALQSA